MAVLDIQSWQPTVWVPPAYGANYRVVLVRKDGTQDDVTNIAFPIEITDAATDGIGSFSVTFPNPNETFTNVYTGMEEFWYFCDYAGGIPTTKRFKGYIEVPDTKNNQCVFTGRRSDLLLADQTFTMSMKGTDIADVVRAMVALKGGGKFTTNNVPAQYGVSVDIDWRQKPFIDCMKDLCSAGSADWYTDATDDIHLFPSGSISNPDEAIVHDYNLLDIGQFAPDVSQVRNLVRVYGASNNGEQVLYTAQDATSRQNPPLGYGTKELVIQDSNITRYEDAQERGDYLLAANKTPPITGDVTSVILATVAPGQTMMISAPFDGLVPAQYPVLKVETEITVDSLQTTITINKAPRTLSKALQRQVSLENQNQDVSDNPYELDYSYSFGYDVDEGTKTNTQIGSGVLSLAAGQSIGTWVSPPRQLPSNLSQVYLNMNAQTITGTQVEVSGNNGVSWQTIPLRTLTSITTAQGSVLMYRITITDPATQIDGVAVLYKLS